MYCAARSAWPLAVRAMQCDSRCSALPQPRILLCTICPCHQGTRSRQYCSPCLSCCAQRAAATGQSLLVALTDVEKMATPRKLFFATATLDSMSETLRKCYIYLNQTSRSFAAVIQALDGDLRQAVCIFYLVLRALDTVEDDMSIPLEVKIPMLQNFHTYLYQPEWRYSQSQEKDRQVLEDFPSISLEFRLLAKVYQDVIANICHKMGAGMAEFLGKKVGSIKDWDMYCHYVAGLVGIGLSRLFSASELEDPVVGKDTELANSMGLFLQKTNIIRDYLEDQQEGREFWPQEVWSKYAEKLSDFTKPPNIQAALQCLNELITNALQHVPDVIKYLSRLHNQSVFNFCAIPQVMAIATLAACYNNPQVFRGVVKIRKGQAVTLMLEATNMEAVKGMIRQYTHMIGQKVPGAGSSGARTQQIVVKVESLSQSDGELMSRGHLSPIYLSLAVFLAAVSWQYWQTLTHTSEEYVHGH
ncbi:squalene synthase isoform X2 [Hemiscyllium ocellatum]|uniref:squalene synthase isoform X2 n=1 Tax=Hemiscyllium ocellatum TaxID=170820 RepID=UPI0029660660|nr:squalene synthase isoform X2 [Hemiscyllium ocellatum]